MGELPYWKTIEPNKTLARIIFNRATGYDNIPQEIVIPEERAGVKLIAYYKKGNEEKTKEYLDKLHLLTKGDNAITADAYYFFYKVLSGSINEAFEWIEAARAKNSFVLSLRLLDPIVKPLREDPRFKKLLPLVYKTSELKVKSSSKKALMGAQEAERAVDKLFAYFKEEKPYLNSAVTLRSLAEELNFQPNQLSWLINECLGKNFNDLINHHRIETFKTLVKDPSNAGITIMGLAYESGFNSKTTFNTSFKKEVGLTPKQFLKG